MRICFCSALSTFKMAEGARFELAAHEVGAGFQDRWIKPLSHPSELGFQLLAECTLLAGKSLGTVWEQFTTIPNAFATSPGFEFTYRWCMATLLTSEHKCQTCLTLLTRQTFLQRPAHIRRVTSEKACQLGGQITFLQHCLANKPVARFHHLRSSPFAFKALWIEPRPPRYFIKKIPLRIAARHWWHRFVLDHFSVLGKRGSPVGEQRLAEFGISPAKTPRPQR